MAPDTREKERPARQDNGTFHPDYCWDCQRRVYRRRAFLGRWLCDACFPSFTPTGT